MQNIIYVGTKPYWEVSLKAPEIYATWVVMQKDDSVWKSIAENPKVLGRLYKYFDKVYTSPKILIFKKYIGSNFRILRGHTNVSFVN